MRNISDPNVVENYPRYVAIVSGASVGTVFVAVVGIVVCVFVVCLVQRGRRRRSPEGEAEEQTIDEFSNELLSKGEIPFSTEAEKTFRATFGEGVKCDESSLRMIQKMLSMDGGGTAGAAVAAAGLFGPDSRIGESNGDALSGGAQPSSVPGVGSSVSEAPGLSKLRLDTRIRGGRSPKQSPSSSSSPTSSSRTRSTPRSLSAYALEPVVSDDPLAPSSLPSNRSPLPRHDHRRQHGIRPRAGSDLSGRSSSLRSLGSRSNHQQQQHHHAHTHSHGARPSLRLRLNTSACMEVSMHDVHVMSQMLNWREVKEKRSQKRERRGRSGSDVVGGGGLDRSPKARKDEPSVEKEKEGEQEQDEKPQAQEDREEEGPSPPTPLSPSSSWSPFDHYLCRCKRRVLAFSKIQDPGVFLKSALRRLHLSEQQARESRSASANILGSMPGVTVKRQFGIGVLLDEIQAEIAVLRSLGHPRILVLWAFAVEPKNHVLGLLAEYCEMGNLWDYVARLEDPEERVLRGGFDRRAKLELLCDIAEALRYLHHRRGVFFRRCALCLSNVMLRHTLSPRLVVNDGVLRVVRRALLGTKEPLDDRVLWGSDRRRALFVAPENLVKTDWHEHNRASDIYSFGMMMFVVLSQDLDPFGDDDEWEEVDVELEVEIGDLSPSVVDKNEFCMRQLGLRTSSSLESLDDAEEEEDDADSPEYRMKRSSLQRIARDPTYRPYLRPSLDAHGTNALILQCWAFEPAKRPKISHVLSGLKTCLKKTRKRRHREKLKARFDGFSCSSSREDDGPPPMLTRPRSDANAKKMPIPTMDVLAARQSSMSSPTGCFNCKQGESQEEVLDELLGTVEKARLRRRSPPKLAMPPPLSLGRSLPQLSIPAPVIVQGDKGRQLSPPAVTVSPGNPLVIPPKLSLPPARPRRSHVTEPPDLTFPKHRRPAPKLSLPPAGSRSRRSPAIPEPADMTFPPYRKSPAPELGLPATRPRREPVQKPPNLTFPPPRRAPPKLVLPPVRPRRDPVTTRPPPELFSRGGGSGAKSAKKTKVWTTGQEEEEEEEGENIVSPAIHAPTHRRKRSILSFSDLGLEVESETGLPSGLPPRAPRACRRANFSKVKKPRSPLHSRNPKLDDVRLVASNVVMARDDLDDMFKSM